MIGNKPKIVNLLGQRKIFYMNLLGQRKIFFFFF